MNKVELQSSGTSDVQTGISYITYSSQAKKATHGGDGGKNKTLNNGEDLHSRVSGLRGWYGGQVGPHYFIML